MSINSVNKLHKAYRKRNSFETVGLARHGCLVFQAMVFLKLLVMFGWKVNILHAFVAPSPSLPHATLLLERPMSSQLKYGEREEIDLLQGKVKILEEVVKELHHRENNHRDSTKTKQEEHQQVVRALEKDLERYKVQETEQTRQFQNLKESQILQGKKYEEDVAAITETLGQRCKESDKKLLASQEKLFRLEEGFKNDTAKLQGRLANREEELNILKEKIKMLGTQGEEENALQNNRISSLERRLRDAEQGKADMEKEHELTLQARNNEISKINLKVGDGLDIIHSLRAELKEMTRVDSDRDEQVEIATAAVEAAQKREKVATTMLVESETRTKQARVILKLQQLTLKALADELREFEEEKKTLRLELQDLRGKQAQAPVRRQNVWKRIRSMFAKK